MAKKSDGHWMEKEAAREKSAGTKGALHRELGVPEGQRIPDNKLTAALHSSNPTERKRANMAEAFKKAKH